MSHDKAGETNTGSILAASVVALWFLFTGNRASAVDFVKDIRPVLQRACFECHGAEKQEAGLRLDRRDAAFQGGDSGRVLVPGKPDAGELIRRVSLPRGHDEAMPPRGKPLSAREIKLLREWIASGANWPDNADSATHWAYVKPVRPAVPHLKSEISNWKFQISDLRCRIRRVPSMFSSSEVKVFYPT